MTKFTKDSSTHPAHGPLTEERLIRVRDELAAAAKRPDGGNLGYMMADAAEAIDEVLVCRAAPQLPQPAVPESPPEHLLPQGSSRDACYRRGAIINGWKLCRAAMLKGEKS